MLQRSTNTLDLIPLSRGELQQVCKISRDAQRAKQSHRPRYPRARWRHIHQLVNTISLRQVPTIRSQSKTSIEYTSRPSCHRHVHHTPQISQSSQVTSSIKPHPSQLTKGKRGLTRAVDTFYKDSTPLLVEVDLLHRQYAHSGRPIKHDHSACPFHIRCRRSL